MKNEKTSFFSKLNPRKYKFGLKIQLLTITLVVISLLVTSIAGLSFLKRAFISTTNQRIEDLGLVKKTQVEDYFTQLEEKVRQLAGDNSILEAMAEFKESYNTYTDYVNLYDILPTAQQDLEVYYKSDISENLENKSLRKIQIDDLIPGSELAAVLQYYYLANNPRNFGEKDKFEKAEDGSYYSDIHEEYHMQLREIARQNNYNDIYLIDHKTGDILYSVMKNPDFATNLYTGPYNNSHLSIAFKSASSSNNLRFVHFEDYASYIPAGYQPVMFVAAPIERYGEKTGILVIQLDYTRLNKVLYGDGLDFEIENNIEYNLVGKDNKLRNNPKQFVTDKKEYLMNLRKRVGEENLAVINVIDKLNSPVLYEGYGKDLDNIRISDTYLHIMHDYSGNKVFAHVIPLSINGLKWELITKIDHRKSMASFITARILMYGIFIVFVVLMVIITNRFSNTIKIRLTQLKDSLSTLVKGAKSKSLYSANQDEIGEIVDTYNMLRSRLRDASDFANNLSKGDYESDFITFGENDHFGSSLKNLKESLAANEEERKKRAEEDEIRNWTNTGLTKFNDILRHHTDSITELSFIIIKNMIEYLEANQGGVYIIEGDEKEKHIELEASYAYDRRKFKKRRIEIGEGMLGNAALEKRTVYMKDIPEDYVEITSGLGGATPRNLIIVPLIVEEEVLGLIELAAFNLLKPHEIEFIEQIADNFAVTLVTVRLNTQTAELLKESNARANAIQQQEEEMRQNMEEMQATQEELARLRQEDEKRTKAMQDTIENTNLFLRNLINNMQGSVMLKDKDGIIIVANEEFTSSFGLKPDKVIGKADIEFMTQEEAKKEHKIDEEVMKEGEKIWIEEKTVDKKKVTYRVIKKSFFIDTIKQLGILTIRINLSE